MSSEVIARIDAVGNLHGMRKSDLPTGAAMIIVFSSTDECRKALQDPSKVRLMAWEDTTDE